MRTINGDKVTVQLVVQFDFTKEEADAFLTQRRELRAQFLDELLSTKHPNPDPRDDYNHCKLYEAIGKAMVGWRESELKQLPESTEGGEA